MAAAAAAAAAASVDANVETSTTIAAGMDTTGNEEGSVNSPNTQAAELTAKFNQIFGNGCPPLGMTSGLPSSSSPRSSLQSMTQDDRTAFRRDLLSPDRPPPAHSPAGELLETPPKPSTAKKGKSPARRSDDENVPQSSAKAATMETTSSKGRGRGGIESKKKKRGKDSLKQKPRWR